ncbi:hypothetical protein LCGC14_2314310 [marine sediment metagenome]|uniref:Uncharacterized protein n=1 Tax=marine sediment metagenome TaxID=412755 RepID=A0A0F9CK98_9ZZZZ
MGKTTTQVWIERHGTERPKVDSCRQFDHFAVLTFRVGDNTIQVFGDLTDHKILGEGILRAVKKVEECRW